MPAAHSMYVGGGAQKERPSRRSSGRPPFVCWDRFLSKPTAAER